MKIPTLVAMRTKQQVVKFCPPGQAGDDNESLDPSQSTTAQDDEAVRYLMVQVCLLTIRILRPCT